MLGVTIKIITVQSDQGKAEYQRSLQQAAQIRALAEAEAEKAARIGIAEAIAIEEKVRACGRLFLSSIPF